MNNDVDFYTEIVLPTVEEFCRNPGDIRLGVLACLVLPERCSLLIALAWASGSACSHRRRDAGRDTPVYLLDLRRPQIGGALAGFCAGRDAQLQRRLPPLRL